MNKRLTLITSFCLWLTLASAVNLDSLWGVWNDKNQPDTNRLKAMQDIAWDGYLFSQPDSAFYFAQIAYELAEAIGNKKQMSEALNIQSVTSYFQGNYEQALEYYVKGLKLQEETGDKRGMAASCNILGGLSFDQGNSGINEDGKFHNYISLEGKVFKDGSRFFIFSYLSILVKELESS